MRMSSLVLGNYRQFRNVSLSFPSSSTADVHVVIGRNGTGKTNLLNAINWCLYAKEPHLTDKSRALPLPNIGAIKQAPNGSDIKVSAEVRLELSDTGAFTFVREHLFRVHDGKPALQETQFKVKCPDPQGNMKIMQGEDATAAVERLLPEGIREYFFFDGERLDGYFKEEAGQRIRGAVFEISQIDLLDTVDRKLGDITRELEREAAKESPAIKEVQDQLEQAEARLSETERSLSQCISQLSTAEQQATDYAEKLRGLPDVEALDKERDGLLKRLYSLMRLVAEKKDDRWQMLHEFGVLLSIRPAITRTIELIKEKRSQGKIPPPVAPQLLQETIETKKCIVCGRDLTAEAAEHVARLTERVRLASDVANELQRIDAPLQMLELQASRFSVQRDKVSRELDGLLSEERSIQARKDEIDAALTKYDQEKVREWARARRESEDLARKLRERKGELRASVQESKQAVEKLKKALETQLKAVDKLRELRRQIGFCSKAKDIAAEAKSGIMATVRGMIERKTSELFLGLVWKKATYDGVEIDDNYNISLNHSLGYNALGSASAAERELLALSFTLALHEVSGFDSPLVIDTPVARVSDTNRENFGKALLQVSSHGKQVILLVTSDEYSSNISCLLDPNAATRRALKLSSTEEESAVEDLGHGTNV